jgi:hypothetical protein
MIALLALELSKAINTLEETVRRSKLRVWRWWLEIGMHHSRIDRHQIPFPIYQTVFDDIFRVSSFVTPHNNNQYTVSKSRREWPCE